MANRRPAHGGGQGHGPGRGQRPGGPARRTDRPSPAPDSPRAEPRGEPERLQKVLAHAGIGSRRACEEVILQGRVTVDGKVVRELGTRVDARRAKIAVDGQRIHSERMVYFAVSKPKGYVSTNNDPSGRPRVVDILPEIPQRVYTVGRLDEMSTGLIILTNDGELANRLAHPKFGVEKLYRAVVAGSPDREVLNKLTEGIWLAEGKVRARRVRVVGKKGEATILEMVLAEGKNREVRRMLAKLGHKVMSLTRIAVGPITLKGLAPGEYRPLSYAEVELLQKVAAGIVVSPARFPERKSPRGPGRPRPSGGPGAPPRRREGAEPGPGGPPPRPPQRRAGTQSQGAPRRPASSGPPPRPPQRRSGSQSQGPPRRPASSGPPPEMPARGKSGGPPRAAAADQVPHGRPPRPPGLPPSQRRPSTGSAPRRPAPAGEDPPARRIIGLDSGARREPPPRPEPRRPPPKRRFPRAGLGPRKPPAPEDEA